MLDNYFTAELFNCQQFILKSIDFNEEESRALLTYSSQEKISEVRCPNCGGLVYSQSQDTYDLKDMPVFYGIAQTVRAEIHRYQCRACGKVFTEDLGMLRHPGTRITERAAAWLRGLLQFHIPISAISSFTGIRWNTVCKIHKEYMEEQLLQRKNELRERKYKPRYLAVDEFSIH